MPFLPPNQQRQSTEGTAPHTYIHTYIHNGLTALCPGLPVWASTRKVKPIWILLKQEIVSWQWHQLGRMQVCISVQTDNLARTPPLSFLQAGCTSGHPTNSVKALKANTYIHTYKQIYIVPKIVGTNEEVVDYGHSHSPAAQSYVNLEIILR